MPSDNLPDNTDNPPVKESPKETNSFDIRPEAFRPLDKKTTGFFEIWEREQELLGLVGGDDDRGDEAGEDSGENEEREPSSAPVHTKPKKAPATEDKETPDASDKPKSDNEAEDSGLPDAYAIPPNVRSGRKRDPGDKLKTLGLALSGGGIRAASFSLGVMQGLNVSDQDKAGPTLLQHVDYLSTVSGGGYAGSALTYYKHLARLDHSEFGEHWDKDVDLAAFPKPEAEVLNRHESRMLDFTRFRKNHLMPTYALNFNSLASVLRTVFTAWPIYLSVLTAVMLCAYGLSELAAPLISTSISDPLEFAVYWLCSFIPGFDAELDEAQIAFGLFAALCSAIFFIGWTVIATFASAWSEHLEKRQYRIRRTRQISLGMVIGVLSAALVYAAIPVLSQLLSSNPAVIAGFVFGGNTIAGISLVSLRQGTIAKRVLTPRVTLILSSVVILLGNLMLAYNFARYLIESAPDAWAWSSVFSFWALGAALLGVGLVATFFANLNYLSFTRMYRDRLMEAFMPNYASFIDKDNNQLATRADRLGLSQCNHRPLHIINTNVVLSTSPISRYRGRAGDSFMLAPHYCGSWVTGYRPTETFSCKKPDNGLGIATAMSISGAAFSPRVGPSGWDTILRHPIVDTTISFLNLRLGFWTANPAAPKQAKRATFWNAGLRGILNYWFDEKRRLIELTDGGHFENTGIFELLRRRVDVIVLADASADRAFNFKDIGIAIERARVDQSVDIRFLDSEYDLTHIMPGSAGETHYDERYNLAKRGYALASIKYPAFKYDSATHGPDTPVPEKYGLLIYLKTAVTRNMPLDIYSYKGAHPVFPNQPITDQNFDESQFEAYRELGFQIVQQLLKDHPDLISGELGRTDNTSTPPNINPKSHTSWAQLLAKRQSL